MGGAAGTGLAFGGIRLLRTLGTRLPRQDLGPGVSIPRLDEISLDGSMFAFSVALSVLTGVLFGLAPAIGRSRANTNSSD
jgi:putative ABC transport system permease protein